MHRARLSMMLVAIVVLVHASSGSASAAAHYPERSITLIVPYPAGGGADYWGQLVAAKLTDALGQPVHVRNVPGAGGNNGAAAAAQSAPDGYTLLLGSVGPLAVHPYTYQTLAFDAERDFSPVALLESSPILLVASRATTATTAEALMNDITAHPGVFTYASNGNGSPEQVAGEVFKRRLNLDIRHIPYDGAGPARKAVVANEASLMFDPCKGALPAIHEGLQHALAVAAPARLTALPEVPTFQEIGVRDYELRIWTGVLVPKGTPRKIIMTLNRAIEDILATPDVRKEIDNEGGRTESTTPAQFAAFLAHERSHWSALVRESAISKVGATAPVVVN